MVLSDYVFYAATRVLSIVFYLGPFVLLLLVVKWLYDSKKSLAEISMTLRELKAEVSAGKTSTENEHE